MDQEKLIEAAKEAEQIANAVSEPFRPTLFAVALEKLMLTSGSVVKGEKAVKRRGEAQTDQQNGKNRVEVLKSVLSARLELSDPEKRIVEKEKTLERSMLALDLVQKRFGIDELAPPEISKILSGNWGQKTSSPNAVSMALKSANNRFVSRRRSDNGYAYSLTPAGRDYIEKLRGEG